MASVKNVKEFNLGLNIPQARTLEGDELAAEQVKLQQIMARKAAECYSTQTAGVTVHVEDKWNVAGEITNEYVKGARFERRDYAIWVNGVLTKFSADSEEAGFTEDKGVKVSVNFTGEQLLDKLVQQQLDF